MVPEKEDVRIDRMVSEWMYQRKKTGFLASILAMRGYNRRSG
jgi:hypothetical protein